MSENASGLLQIFVYLCLLIGVLAGGLYFFRNGFSFLQKKAGAVKKLEISETRMLGNRQFLVVAEYEGKKVLIGVCPGRIDYICRLDRGDSDEEQFAEMVPEKPE